MQKMLDKYRRDLNELDSLVSENTVTIERLEEGNSKLRVMNRKTKGNYLDDLKALR